MAKNELEIRLLVKDEMSKQLKKIEGVASKSGKKMHGSFVNLAAGIFLAKQAFRLFSSTITKSSKAIITTASKVEDLNVRMKGLIGSAHAGNKVFKDMAIFAGKVPKTYDEIMESATDLAGVVKDGTKEISQLMPIIVDIASGTGLSVQETTSQVIRMYSAGAAAADMFRERGISAALGFSAGVKYTNKETMDILTKQWEDGTGKFVGMSDELAKTFTGMVSMLQDAWFQFKTDIGKEVFESVKIDLDAILLIIKESKTEGGEYVGAVNKLAKALDNAYESSIQFVGAMVIGAGQAMDAWSAVRLVLAATHGMFLMMTKAVYESALYTAEESFISKIFGSEEEAEEARAGLMAINAEISRIAEETESLLILTGQDFSAEIKKEVDAFFQLLELKREEVTLDTSKQAAIDKYNASLKMLTAGQKEGWKLSAEWQKELEKLNKSMQTAMAGTLSDIVLNAKTAKEAVKDLGNAMLKMIVDMIAKWVVAQVVAQGLQMLSFTSTTAVAASTAAAWAPAAVLASIATAGTATAAGMAAMAGAAASTPMISTTFAAMSRGGASLTGGAGAGASPASGALSGASQASGFATGTDSVPAMLTRGEMVVPRSFADAIREGDLSLSGGGGGSTISIEIYNPQITNESNIEDLAEAISNKLNVELERI